MLLPGPRQKGNGRQWETPPDDTLRVLAGVCSSTKVLFAHAVPQKGDDSNGNAAKCLVDSIAWMGHSKVTIRSDNEPAICDQGSRCVFDDERATVLDKKTGKEVATFERRGGLYIAKMKLKVPSGFTPPRK